MPIYLNTLLLEAGIELSEVRLLRHKDNRADKGMSPYELWRDDRALFEAYQSIQSIKNRSKFQGKYWVSCVGSPNGETLFVGLYAVNDCRILEQDKRKANKDGYDYAGTADEYTLVEDNRFSEYSGKIVIDWGEGDRAWIQRADRQNKRIIELRKEFSEPAFPGFLEFYENLSRLDTLPTTWISILRSTRGIYLLTCPKTKEQYVGSTLGSVGFWGRWQDYIRTGHGGNIALMSREPSDYQVSILEVAGTALTEDDILRKETLWKKKLQSRDMGLNRN